MIDLDKSDMSFSANLFDAGLNDNGLVKFAAQHWYQVSTDIGAYTPETQQEYLLNHDAIASLWDSGYDAALEYVGKYTTATV